MLHIEILLNFGKLFSCISGKISKFHFLIVYLILNYLVHTIIPFFIQVYSIKPKPRAFNQAQKNEICLAMYMNVNCLFWYIQGKS